MRIILKLFLPEQLKFWSLFVAVSSVVAVVASKVLGWNLAEVYFICLVLAYLVALITCDGGMGRNTSWLLNLPLPRRSLALGRVALGFASLVWFFLYAFLFGLVLLFLHQGPVAFWAAWQEGRVGRLSQAFFQAQDAGWPIELASLSVILFSFFVLSCTVTFNQRNMQELRERAVAHWRASSPVRRFTHAGIYALVLFVLYRFLVDAPWFWVALFAAFLTAGGVLNLVKSLSFSRAESRRAYAIMALLIACQTIPLYGQALYYSKVGSADRRAYAIAYLGAFGVDNGREDLAILLSSGLDEQRFDEIAQIYRRRFLNDKALPAAGTPSFAKVVEAAHSREQVEVALRHFRGLSAADVALALTQGEAHHWNAWNPASLALLLEVPMSQAFVEDQILSLNPGRNLYGLTKARYQMNDALAHVITRKLPELSETNFFRAQETLSLAHGRWLPVADIFSLLQGRVPASLGAAAPDCQALHYRKVTKESELLPFQLCARGKIKSAELIQPMESIGWMEFPVNHREEVLLQRLFP